MILSLMKRCIRERIFASSLFKYFGENDDNYLDAWVFFLSFLLESLEIVDSVESFLDIEIACETLHLTIDNGCLYDTLQIRWANESDSMAYKLD